MSEDWYTHRVITELVRELYGGTIDLDPMSCAEANVTVRADLFYTAHQDGLRYPWTARDGAPAEDAAEPSLGW